MKRVGICPGTWLEHGSFQLRWREDQWWWEGTRWLSLFLHKVVEDQLYDIFLGLIFLFSINLTLKEGLRWFSHPRLQVPASRCGRTPSTGGSHRGVWVVGFVSRWVWWWLFRFQPVAKEREDGRMRKAGKGGFGAFLVKVYMKLAYLQRVAKQLVGRCATGSCTTVSRCASWKMPIADMPACKPWWRRTWLRTSSSSDLPSWTVWSRHLLILFVGTLVDQKSLSINIDMRRDSNKTSLLAVMFLTLTMLWACQGFLGKIMACNFSEVEETHDICFVCVG